MKRVVLPCLLLALAGCAHDGYLRAPVVEASAVPDPKEDRAVYVGLIQRMQQEGAWYASLAHIDAYRQRYGDNPQLRALQAEALRRTGQTDAATALYRSLLKGPQAAAAWHGLGLIAASAERPGEAEDALARAVALDPLNVDYLGDLGFHRLREGEGAQAREPLAQAAELAPSDTRAVANLALWTLLHGEASQAEAIMRQAALPEATRSEIYRLAGSLRNARPRAPQAGRADNGVADAPAPRRGAIAAPPSMLQRFGGQAAPPQENTP
jgi:Flp pilus assembly protein TadD